jgi:putative addiction module killer protein
MARGVIEKEIIIYADEDGTEPYSEWLGRLKDKQTIKRIQTRLLRLEQGNYGDYKSLKDGVFELRLMFGSGYRVYFGEDGDKLVILLLGGDKSTQTQDIEQAKIYWKEYIDHA